MKAIQLSLLTCVAFHQPAWSEPVTAFESPAAMDAAKVLDPSLMQGPNHRIRNHVGSDGYMLYFELDTDFGIIHATGVPQVKARIAEVNAMAKLAEVSKSDLFAEGLKRSIEQPIDAVKNIVTNPIDSVKKAPKTVGHFFSKFGSALERETNKIKEDHKAGESPDINHLAGVAGKVVGFDKARLGTAKQLGVDPYSDNKRLQEEMDKVTWAFFAGGLPLRIGAAAASAGTALVATKMVGIPEDIYALTQTEIALRDNKSLTAMGVPEKDISAFQIQPQLSTTRRHRIVKSLEALSGVTGRERVIQLANTCETTEQADFLVSSLSMLAERQQTKAAEYKELHVHGRLPAASNAAGITEVAAPVDYVTWTEQVAGFAQRDDLGKGPKLLVHTGTLSEATKEGLRASGWTTVQVGYP